MASLKNDANGGKKKRQVPTTEPQLLGYKPGEALPIAMKKNAKAEAMAELETKLGKGNRYFKKNIDEKVSWMLKKVVGVSSYLNKSARWEKATDPKTKKEIRGVYVFKG